MALSWTMDKIGPICRSVEDCAVVFDAIAGPDGIDATVEAEPFSYSPIDDPKKVRVGYVRALFEEDYPERASDSTTLDVLRGLGFELEPIDLPDYPVYPLSIILVAEAAAAFDELTRSNSDSLLVRQIRAAWPNVFRESRFIPAVEYIQANRIRTLLMEEMQRLEVDVYVAPSFGGDNLLLTNLTGHPCVVLPNGFSEDGTPVSISFMGQLNGEGVLLGVANSYQNATVFHKRHPQHFE